MKFDAMFAVIAMREVIFFANVARRLKEKNGIESLFLTFYQPGDRYLKDNGFHVASLHGEIRYEGIDISPVAVRAFEERHELSSIRDLLRHEMLTHRRFDEPRLIRKTLAYERYFLKLFRELGISCCVQELGGFIAPLALYYCARHEKVRHIFLEPSMFRSMLFFNEDSTEVQIRPSGPYSAELRRSVDAYLQSYRDNKMVLVPQKDAHHFHDMGLRKMVNKRNLVQLSRKLANKYIMGYAEEYDAIYQQVRERWLMLARRAALSRSYAEPDYSRLYVYFPLHVPLDFQLTVREPRFLNQMSLAGLISDLLPFGYDLYIKEHPASVGGYSWAMLRDLLRRPNVKLIHPRTNSFDLIAHSRLVITVNSKVGAEALMQGKRVVVLGKTYYRDAPGAHAVRDLDELRPVLERGLQDTPSNHDGSAFFYRVYAASRQGELYDNSEQNVESFSRELLEVLDR